MTKWMNEFFFISMWSKTVFVLHTCEQKENNGKVKQNTDQYEVREGSPFGVQWTVQMNANACKTNDANYIP